MPDQTEPDPQQTGGEPNDGGTGGDGDDARERAFWDRMDKRIDAGIDRAIGKWRKSQPPGSSRNGGNRTSIPSILADFVFGPPKGDD